MTVTRTSLPSGKFRYEVDGKVHTAKSTRLYTHASVYRTDDERLAVFLHARADLAAKGSPDAKRCGWTQVDALEIISVAS